MSTISFKVILVSILVTISHSFVPAIFGAKSGGQRSSYRLFSETPVVTPAASTGTTEYPYPGTAVKPTPVLTQKEYLILVRNRLFSVEEQIWLHEYALAHPKGPTVFPLSPKKYEELLKTKKELLESYPVTKLYSDLAEAQAGNMTYAAMYIDRLISNFNRQIPMTLQHINQIAVVSYPGETVNLMRGQGSVHHRLVPSAPLSEKGIKRQFQQPVFSNKGKYVALAEMHVKESTSALTAIVRSNALVYEVPQDAKTFGAKDSMPIFDSLELPGIPVFLRFSPDDESLVMICSNTATDGASSTSLNTMRWGKYAGKKAIGGQEAMARFAPRKVETLMTGKDMFFTYTTSSANNASIVAHSERVMSPSVDVSVDNGKGNESDKDTEKVKEEEKVIEKAVWIQRAGLEESWSKVSVSSPTDRWSTPVCHSAGGGDSVLVIEDGWLVTKALSRWKRDENGELKSKRIMEVKGEVNFLVSPDNSRAVLLQEDIDGGHYSLTVIEGEDALDPCSPSLGHQYEMPNPNLTVAFWFSPDSTKLLCLTATGKNVQDVITQKTRFRVALNSDVQYSVFNFPLQELREYNTFKPTPYFMKTYVSFASQYAQVYNPWAPDSRSFVYVTSAGMFHTPLVGSRHCLGEDTWHNQGATFGTWSRQ